MSVIVPESSKIMRRSTRPVGFKSPLRLIKYLEQDQISTEAFINIINSLSIPEDKKNLILNHPRVVKAMKENTQFFWTAS
ncbi:hypothetical protein ACFODZ_08610 [Marinicella sediminis]|uniref:Uncharacterized protein n=1 Tax=Marinicella sediminis TaxID=1792834 RepID=A0ABV7J843_9GAMM|nr:hypothetical protein [Marinicella sediminis]